MPVATPDYAARKPAEVAELRRPPGRGAADRARAGMAGAGRGCAVERRAALRAGRACGRPVVAPGQRALGAPGRAASAARQCRPGAAVGAVRARTAPLAVAVGA